LVLQRRLPLPESGHRVAQIAIVLTVFGLIYFWLRANAMALRDADWERERLTITATELQPSWPPQASLEPGNGRQPMFPRSVPEAGLRHTLGDTFELEAPHRAPTDIPIN
jgi:hypothetical protein